MSMLQRVALQSTLTTHAPEPAPSPSRLQALIDRVIEMDQRVQSQAIERQHALPDLAVAPGAQRELGPKYPGQAFNYLRELDRGVDDTPLADDALLDEISRYFRGSIRPHAANSLFNMVPEASVGATAASWLATAYNSNSLMDAFGGESLLVEQQVARTIGTWAGWPQSMGIACNGGKFTIMYAIKSALSRIAPESLREGLPRDLVILCSEGAHYCVEHAASLLGLGSGNCLRVASGEDGQMRPEALREKLQTLHAQGRRVAAIVCCGGTTINFNCEDTTAVRALVEDFVDSNGLDYRPYLHLDSVIGWLYLSLSDCDAAQLRQRVPDAASRARIQAVTERMRGLSGFDSLGVDFHKDGLCPYASSFFVARDRRFMDELGDGSYRYGEKDFEFGQFRAYRYTFENSRPSQGILAAWVNLKQLGRRGYGDYLAGLHGARNALCAAIERHGLFRVLNRASLGWEIVFEVPFAPDLIELAPSYQDLALSFMQECWDRVTAGYDLPLFSIVPGYRIDNDPASVTTGFLLYPMQPRSDAQWDEVVERIAAQFRDFETRLRNQPIALSQTPFEKPIR